LYPAHSPYRTALTIPHLRSACPIVASDPPATENFKLGKALHIVCHSECPEERARAWQKAIRICIQERNGACLEWLSRHHATAEGHALQPDARLQLTGRLSAHELRYVLEWNRQRVHQAPLELGFHFVGHRLTDAHVEGIAALLESATVKAVTLNNCHLTDQGMCTLAQGLRGNHCIESLELGENTLIGLHGMATLAKALDGNTSLKRLDLSMHKSKGGLALLCEALKMNPCLSDLNLYGAKGSSTDADALGQLISEARALKVLNLTFARFSPPGEYDRHALGRREKPLHKAKRKLLYQLPTKRVKAATTDTYPEPIYTAIESCRGLETLKINLLKDDDRGATALSKLLSFNHITHLDISGGLADEQADILGPALSTNRSLLHLECLHKGLASAGSSTVQNNLTAQARFREKLIAQAPEALGNLLDQVAPRLRPPMEALLEITKYLPPESKLNLVLAAQPEAPFCD
jgi:Ran GTPase-activating protein (RanGAP) involved in mRNA processing and transport